MKFHNVIAHPGGMHIIQSFINGFFNPSSGPITTMSVSKKQVKDKQFRLVIDLESIFLQLLMIGQQWQMEIEPVFACICM